MGLTTFLAKRPPVRGLLWVGLTDTARFLVRSEVSDGGGGWTDTYVPEEDADWAKTTNIPCRIDTLSGGEGTQAGAIADTATHLITLPPGTAVSIDDDIQIQYVGRFEIQAVRLHSSERVTQIEVSDRTQT